MKHRLITLSVAIFSLLVFSCQPDERLALPSPDGKTELMFQLKDGVPVYSVFKSGTAVLKESSMGFQLKSQNSLSQDFSLAASVKSVFDDTWTQPWGEVKTIRNQYNAMKLMLQEESGEKRKLNIEFRVYNDGIGFRYEFPEQASLKEFIITNELTEFALPANFTAWWIPAYLKPTDIEMDSEFLYHKDSVSQLQEKVHTPLTMSWGDSLYVSIHEAALIDYPAMTLYNRGDKVLKADLVPWNNGNLAEVKAPFKTPWRTIQIAKTPGELITSYLILNLNEPNKLGDVSWIKPGKYNGMWWGMHMKENTWSTGSTHGATTKNVKQLIDFASQHKLSSVLVEGWNEGWDGDWVANGNFSFTKSYPDYNLAELSRYAKKKGVGLIGHHETGGNVANYEAQLEDGFKLLNEHGIRSVKTGYVNKKPGGEFHQSQFMVRHYQKVMETAARYNVMLDVHEPIKDTGLRRTWPNMMTREGVRGTEYEAWSIGNPPSHTTILPFTRGLAGPIDYTPGIFNILFDKEQKFRVHTTLAKQLALYVVIYSPLHMAADLPRNYDGKAFFKFIEDVPTDWEETKVLNGVIGEYITTVRKDRNSDEWFLGSITNEKARTLEIKLDFLPSDKKFIAEIYQDGKDADVDANPLSIETLSREVDSGSTLTLILAPGGGTAIRFKSIK